MRPITIHTRRFPPRGFYAITIFPVVFYNGEKLSEREVRHETVHLWQQATLLVVPFYLLYLAFWVAGLLRYRDCYRAYMEIPFERSAYALEAQQGLPWHSKAFDWMKRLKKQKI